MNKISKKSAIVELMAKAAMKKEMNQTEKEDYKASIEIMNKLGQNIEHPVSRFELSQIIAYTVDTLLDVRVNDYLPLVGEVRTVGFQERPKFKTRQGDVIRGYWVAEGSTPEISRIGYSYQDIQTEQLSAIASMEQADILYGRIEWDQILRDITNSFEYEIVKKVEDTLYAGFSAMPTPNYASGTGVIASTLDPLITAMSRFGQVTIVGDLAVVQKLTALSGFANPSATGGGYQMSPNIIDEFHNNGFIGKYRGANVVALSNPYFGLAGYNTPLKKNLLYIVPAQNDVDKALKVLFRGEVTSMDKQVFEDRSYMLRFDKYMGAGLLNVPRYAMAVYEDTSL